MQCSDELPAENPFTPELLAWRIQRLLPGYLNRAGFESLKHYAADGRHGLKLAQLCYRVADVFDQYTIYRPEMILRWEQGEELHWQAQLWRARGCRDYSGASGESPAAVL